MCSWALAVKVHGRYQIHRLEAHRNDETSKVKAEFSFNISVTLTLYRYIQIILYNSSKKGIITVKQVRSSGSRTESGPRST